MKYTGWELHNFDQANLYRSYQYSLIKDDLKGNILEVGPAEGHNSAFTASCDPISYDLLEPNIYAYKTTK